MLYLFEVLSKLILLYIYMVWFCACVCVFFLWILIPSSL